MAEEEVLAENERIPDAQPKMAWWSVARKQGTSLLKPTRLGPHDGPRWPPPPRYGTGPVFGWALPGCRSASSSKALGTVSRWSANRHSRSTETLRVPRST